MYSKLQLLLGLLLALNLVTAFPTNVSKVLSDEGLKPIGLDDVLENKFRLAGFNGIWISANEFSYKDSDGNFVKYNVEDESFTTILSKDVLEQWKPSVMELNADNSLVLMRYQDRQLFRHSIIARYVIYDLDNETPIDIQNGEEIQLAIWSPTRKSVAYVFENNVYYLDLESGEDAIQLTEDGEVDVIYNGFTDWVYEEEVFGNSKGMWFSPTGERLAVAHFDDTQVKTESYFMYGEPGAKDTEYPEFISLRYPKSGEVNPRVEIRVFDLLELDAGFQVINPPTTEEIGDPILGSVSWIDEYILDLLWLNRRQNKAILRAYNTIDVRVSNNIYEAEEPNGWIDADTLTCFGDENCYIKYNYNGWKRLIRRSYVSRENHYLTPDKVTALQFLGYRQDINEAYVITTGHNVDPVKDFAYRHMYKIKEPDSFDCVSCSITSPEGDKCTYVSNVRFSKDYSYFALTCTGPGPSYTKIFKNEEDISDGKLWEGNTNTRKLLEEYHKTNFRYLKVPVGPRQEFEAMVKMHLPLCYDPSSDKKYPMIVQVYGGPGSVRVLDNFGIGFADYMAQSRNVIWAQIDGRGSGNKGTDMLFTINNKMGTVEIEDQIEVTKYLVRNLNFIDKDRVGIWGWSYGGYASAMALVHDDDHVFQGGISVAPVTSWLFYDTIYTERFMGVPNDNQIGYNVSNLNWYAEKMEGRDYMLIHGNADDNVHYQQAMVWTRALIEAGIDFEQLSYPDEAHGLTGVQKHLYHTMDAFWTKCIKISPLDETCS